jgi:MFS family permease
MPHPLRERNFRLLFGGRAVSVFGDAIAPIALAFAVLDLTGSATDLGYVLAGSRVPMVLLVLLGGVWADRLPRRLVMLTSDVVRAAMQLTIAALLLAHVARIWELVALSVLFGAADAFFSPAATGLTPLTLPLESLHQGNALFSIADSASRIVGPAVAGILIAVANPGTALAVDGGTFVVSALFLSALRLPTHVRPEQSTTVVHDLRDGWREVRSRRWLWVSIAYWCWMAVAAFPVFFVLGPYIAKQSLGGASAWAAILSTGGVGGLAGALVGMKTKPRHQLRTCLTLMLLLAPAFVLLAFRLPTAAIAAGFFVFSFAMGWGWVLWPTILQQQVPPYALSRVSAWDTVGTLALNPIALALVGPVAGLAGTKATLLGAAVLLVAATLVVLSVREIRELEAPSAG